MLCFFFSSRRRKREKEGQLERERARGQSDNVRLFISQGKSLSLTTSAAADNVNLPPADDDCPSIDDNHGSIVKCTEAITSLPQYAHTHGGHVPVPRHSSSPLGGLPFSSDPKQAQFITMFQLPRDEYLLGRTLVFVHAFFRSARVYYCNIISEFACILVTFRYFSYFAFFCLFFGNIPIFLTFCLFLRVFW